MHALYIQNTHHGLNRPLLLMKSAFNFRCESQMLTFFHP